METRTSQDAPVRYQLAALGVLLGTLLTGCGSDLEAIEFARLAGADPGGMSATSPQATAAGDGVTDPSGVRADLRNAALQAAFGQLAALPQFDELLDTTGVTKNQAEVLLQAWLEQGSAATGLRSMALSRFAELATDSLLSIPQVQALADQTGLEPDQVQALMTAMIGPEQTTGAVFSAVASQELQRLTAEAN